MPLSALTGFEKFFHMYVFTCICKLSMPVSHMYVFTAMFRVFYVYVFTCVVLHVSFLHVFFPSSTVSC